MKRATASRVDLTGRPPPDRRLDGRDRPTLDTGIAEPPLTSPPGRVVEQCAARVLKQRPPMLQHVAPMTDRQREVHVLLDQQHGDVTWLIVRITSMM
jgi:hypothetical protein